MARSTDEILAHGKLLVSPEYHAAEPHMASVAAQMARADRIDEELLGEQVYIGSARGLWLRLHAEDFGLGVVDDEPIESIRARIRSMGDAVTEPALQAAVDAVLSVYGVTGLVVPHWTARPVCNDDEPPEFPTDFFADGLNILGSHRHGSVIVPTGLPDAAYDAVCAEVERLRSAGERWFLIIEDGFAPYRSRL